MAEPNHLAPLALPTRPPANMMAEHAKGGKERSLYDRLGGIFSIAALVDAFSDAYDAGQMIGEAIEERNPLLGVAGTGMAALAALPGGVASRRGAKMAAEATLPMDAASVSARRQAMGYSEEPFYRGDAGTATEYHGGYFARDPDTAHGHARRYQGDPNATAREFHLNLQEAFPFDSDRSLTPAQRDRLIAAIAEENPKIAGYIREDIDDGVPLALIYTAIERNTAGADGVLRRAGFTAVDRGGNVRMLGGHGIRSADAVFDPSRAHLPNIYYGLPFAALAPLGTAPEER